MIWIITILFYTFVLQVQLVSYVSKTNISGSSRRMDESSISFLQRCSWTCSDRDILFTQNFFNMQVQKRKNQCKNDVVYVTASLAFQKLLKVLAASEAELRRITAPVKIRKYKLKFRRLTALPGYKNYSA